MPLFPTQALRPGKLAMTVGDEEVNIADRL